MAALTIVLLVFLAAVAIGQFVFGQEGALPVRKLTVAAWIRFPDPPLLYAFWTAVRRSSRPASRSSRR